MFRKHNGDKQRNGNCEKSVLGFAGGLTAASCLSYHSLLHTPLSFLATLPLPTPADLTLESDGPCKREGDQRLHDFRCHLSYCPFSATQTSVYVFGCLRDSRMFPRMSLGGRMRLPCALHLTSPSAFLISFQLARPHEPGDWVLLEQKGWLAF